MSILSDRDREFILKQLRTAPDSVLADAMLEFNLIRDKIVAVRKLTKEPQEVISSEMTVTEPAPNIEINPLGTVHASQSKLRPNVDPGKPEITKIGSKTKDQIIQWLKDGTDIRADLYGEHLKLLWSRGEVKFDGARWYV